MADKKISELTAITGADTAADDYFIVVDTSGSATKKISRAELNNAIEQDVLAQVDITSANIDGGTIDNTPIGASTPSTGAFTTLTTTGTTTLGGNLDTNGNDITGTGNINITGTVTSDGLAVDGSATITDTNVRLNLIESDATDLNTRFQSTGGGFYLRTITDDLTGVTSRLKVDHSTGDVSLYDSTGVSQGFFWDASAQRLGLGTTTPASTIHLENANSPAIRIKDTTNNVELLVASQDTTAFLGTFSNHNLDFYTNSTRNVTITSGGNVGIGTSSPSSYWVDADDLVITSSGTHAGMTILAPSISANSVIAFADGTGTSAYEGAIEYLHSSDAMRFRTAETERLRIDSSGNLLVGKTSAATSTAGVQLASNGRVEGVVDGGEALRLNRITSDGDVVVFRKDNTTVGSIGTLNSDLTIGSSGAGLRMFNGNSALTPFDVGTNSNLDGTLNLGYTNQRFKNLYLSGGVYLGGTGSANLLDDYEEGTYTVSVTTGNTGSITLDTANDTFTYTKIGGLVHVQGRVRVDSVSSPTGFIYVSLPFTIANLGESASMFSGSVTISGISSGNVSDFLALGIEGNSNFRIYLGDAVSIQDDSAQQILASTLIYASITYRSA
jgi:hypothetical protein